MDQQRRRKQRSDIQGTTVDSFLYDEPGLQILAYLESTLMHSIPLEYFAPDVIFYYKEHLQRVISVSQIEEKLQFFWSRWHPLGDKPSEWRKIYHLGLKGLPRLEEEWREWVRERAIGLKGGTEGTPRRLRSTSTLPRTLPSPAKRPTRSSVGTPNSSRVRKSWTHGEFPKQRRTRRKTSVRVNARRTPNSSIPERELSTMMVRECSQNRRDDLTPIKNELVSSNRSSPSEQLRWSTEQSRCSQMMSELNDLRDQNVQMMSELDDLRDQNVQIMSELDDVRDRNAHLISELDELRSQKAEDTQYWERLYQKTLKRRNSLKRRNKHIQAEHGIGQDEVGRMNLKLRSENDLLQEKLDSYRATFQFKEPFVEDFRAQNVREAVKHFDLLLLKLHKVLQGQDALFSIETLDNIERPDILALFKRGFDLEMNVDDSGRSAIPTTEICGTKLRSVVLSLVSAALCTWVFEAEVGALFQENNLVYSKLQSLLVAQDEKLTNSFEFAAHEKCVDDPFVRDIVIPRRARHLARRILACTMPLLEAHRNLNEDYAVIADEWLEAGQQLTEIFNLALHAKVRLLLSTDMYKCTLHVPGTPFDSNSMQNIIERVPDNTDNERVGVVDITIFPGLIRYASKEDGFNYNRFLVGKTAPKGIIAEVLRRAVVLIR